MIKNDFDVEKKNYSLHIKINEEERELLEKCAEADGRKVSQMATHLIKLCCHAMMNGASIQMQKITVDNGK